MDKTGNPHVKFMHCLSVVHDRETLVAENIHQSFGPESVEVSEEGFESPASIVFDEAENRVRATKAAVVAALGD